MRKLIHTVTATIFTGAASLLSAATFADQDLNFDDAFGLSGTDIASSECSERDSSDLSNGGYPSDTEVGKQSFDASSSCDIASQKLAESAIVDVQSPRDVNGMLGTSPGGTSLGDAMALYFADVIKVKEARDALIRREKRESIGEDLKKDEDLVRSIVNGHNPVEGMPGVRLQLVYDSGLTTTIDANGKVVQDVPEILSPVTRRGKFTANGSETD